MTYKVETTRVIGQVDRSSLGIVDLRSPCNEPALISFRNVSDVALADKVCKFLNDERASKVA